MQFPSEGAALPGFVTGVGWSDHWAFWQVGYPALMVTDTAPFRNPNYHTQLDTPDTLDYDRLARVTAGSSPSSRSSRSDDRTRCRFRDIVRSSLTGGELHALGGTVYLRYENTRSSR